MKFTAEQIAGMLEGTVEGNSSAVVSGLSKIEEGKVGTLTFLANQKYLSYIYTTGATIAIVSNDFKAEQALPDTLTLVRVKDAYGSFAKLLEAYSQLKKPRPSIHSTAIIDATAVIGENVHIGAFAIIGAGSIISDHSIVMAQAYIGDNVRIGTNTTLHPGVKVYSECIIGSGCTLHAGVIIGADGFGFAPQADNQYSKIPQIGNVVIEDRAEIGANTTIDRATLGSTIIREGVKLDNLIQIAHNVEIGKNTVIAALTGIAGSTKIGENCMIGGQVGIAGHLTIANGVKIAAQTGISASVIKENIVLQGTPVMEISEFRRTNVIHRRLPKLLERIERLEKGQK